MSQVLCPHCEKGLKIPPEKRGKLVRCPVCKEKFRVPGGKSERPQEARPQRTRTQQTRSQPNRKRSRRTGARSRKSETLDITGFVKKLVLPSGIVLGLATLLIIGGFFSEYSGLAASGLLILATVVAIALGRIWMAMDVGKAKGWPIGLAAMFVPLVGLVISFKEKGPSLRGAITFLSSLLFLLPLGLTVLLFAPDANGRPAFGPRAPSKAMTPEAWADRIVAAEEKVTPDSPVVSVTASITSRGAGSVQDLASRGESLLAQFDSYVAGSLSVDDSSRELTFQYRGQDHHKNAYCFFVGLSTNNFVRAK